MISVKKFKWGRKQYQRSVLELQKYDKLSKFQKKPPLMLIALLLETVSAACYCETFRLCIPLLSRIVSFPCRQRESLSCFWLWNLAKSVWFDSYLKSKILEAIVRLSSLVQAGFPLTVDDLCPFWKLLLTAEAWRLWFWWGGTGPGCDRSPWVSPNHSWTSATNPSYCTRWRRWSR